MERTNSLTSVEGQPTKASRHVWMYFSLIECLIQMLGFAVDKVALRQVLFKVLRTSPVNIIQPWLSILMPSG
jgi:hypothetical protein